MLRPRFAQKIRQLDIPGCLTLLSAGLTMFIWCKDRLVDFYYTQQRRLTYVDEIPDIKKDVAGIKKDIADIKAMLSRPWFKRLP